MKSKKKVHKNSYRHTSSPTVLWTQFEKWKKSRIFYVIQNCKIGHTLHTKWKLVAFWCVLNLVKNAAKFLQFNDLWCVPTPPKSRIIPSIFFSFEKRTQCTLIDLLVDQFWQAHCVYIWILKCRTSKKTKYIHHPLSSLSNFISQSLLFSRCINGFYGYKKSWIVMIMMITKRWMDVILRASRQLRININSLSQCFSSEFSSKFLQNSPNQQSKTKRSDGKPLL